MADVTLKDNSAAAMRELQGKVKNALVACGMTAEGYAKEDCPVDTGRLRNSITYVTSDEQSPANTNKHPNGQADAQPSDYKPLAKPENNTVYIGTNVEYAGINEFGSLNHKVGKAHFIRDSVAKHQDEYKAIIKAALK